MHRAQSIIPLIHHSMQHITERSVHVEQLQLPRAIEDEVVRVPKRRQRVPQPVGVLFQILHAVNHRPVRPESELLLHFIDGYEVFERYRGFVRRHVVRWI